MSYRFRRDERLPDAVRRVADEQLAEALTRLRAATTIDGAIDGDEAGDEAGTAGSAGADFDAAIHDARKRFKEVRALLRLLRDELGEARYARENRALRDAGRALAAARDGAVLVTTLDALRERYADQLYNRAFASIRAALLERHRRLRGRLLEAGRVAEVAAEVEAARLRVADWPLERDDWPALAGGVERIYRRGRKAFGRAYAQPDAAAFHEWRKRVKYLWYGSRLLGDCWPRPLEALADELSELSDLLGDDHDLAVLRAVLSGGADEPGGLDGLELDDATEVEALGALAERAGAELRRRARPLGERLYAEAPAAFRGRLGAYWCAWRRPTASESA